MTTISTTTSIPTQTTSTSSSQSASSQVPANPNGQLTDDSFLQMLMTEMQYQDPLDGSDGSSDDSSSSSMLTQLAEYSEIEALTSLQQTNQTLSQEVGVVMGQQMLGKNVTVTDSNGNTVTGTVTAVQNSSGNPQIVINGTAYPTSDVTQIG